MKTLFIIRHAKSDQSFFGNDFERPLNQRGKSDAPVMAGRLQDKKIPVDAFISSPAKRALQTAELFCKAFKKSKEDIVLITALYHAAAETFYEVIKQTNDSFDTIAVFSHNPGITYFINDLIANVRIDNMPTCGIFAVNIDCKSWKDFAKAKKEFLFFDYPKNI